MRDNKQPTHRPRRRLTEAAIVESRHHCLPGARSGDDESAVMPAELPFRLQLVQNFLLVLVGLDVEEMRPPFRLLPAAEPLGTQRPSKLARMQRRYERDKLRAVPVILKVTSTFFKISGASCADSFTFHSSPYGLTAGSGAVKLTSNSRRERNGTLPAPSLPELRIRR
jgi:hypothetical protein